MNCNIRLLVTLLLTIAPVPAQVLTWHNDSGRTGQNLNETALRPDNVNTTTFGKLFIINVDGKVDAQPLYVPSLAIAGGMHNVLFVVTEHDSAYAFDADSGTQYWHVSLLANGETTSDDRGCGQVTPEIGITSTPVIDPHIGPHGILYTVAMSESSGSVYHQRLHALDLATGAEQLGGPIVIQATFPGAGAGSSGGVETFDPKQYKERSGLAIVNGVVYTAWASHCDDGPYNGWVIGYNESSLSRVSVIDLTPNGSDGAIWGAGAGPAFDASGNLYILMANGTFDTTLTQAGFPIDGDYGNAVVKLSTASNSLSVSDYFTMYNTVGESNMDQDLGSGGLILLPPLNDSQSISRNLAVGAGKDGNIYVVDTGNMGKFHPNVNTLFQELPSAVGGVFSTPAWFNGVLYYGGSGDHIKAFTFSGGSFEPNPATTSQTFEYPGATPSISAFGNQHGIVWAAENSGNAVLHAFNAADLTELYNTNMAANSRDNFGSGNKFIVPTVANGKVYVGTESGVGVFGLLGSHPILSDFDGNKVPDLVWQDASTRQVTVNYYGGTGGATYQGWNWLNKAGVPGWHVAAVADFNQDGVPDLIWVNDTTRQAVVHYYGGAGGAVDQNWNWLDQAGEPGWSVVAAADFNQDGVPDLVWQNDTTRQVVVHYYGGSGGAVQQGSATLDPGVAGWRVAAAADFNGDHVPDLVWQDDSTGQVVVHYYGGSGGAVYQGWNWLNQAPVSGWNVVYAADFNNDGVPDLVWQNNSTSQVTVHYYGGSGGAVLEAWNWLNITGATGWSVVN